MPAFVVCTARAGTSATFPGAVRVNLTRRDGAHGTAAGVALAHGVAATCAHVVARAESLVVDDVAANVTHVCDAADVALLAAPAMLSDRLDSVSVWPGMRLSVGQCSLVLKRVAVVKGGPVFVCEGRGVGPGWSGMPVMCAESGGLVGIVSGVADGEDVHVIPARILQSVLKGAGTGRKVGIGALEPLTVQPLCAHAVRVATGVEPEVHGVRVARGGAHFGLAVGDVIVEVDGHPLDDSGSLDWDGIPAPFQVLLGEMRPGDDVEIKAYRPGDGRYLLLHSKLASADLGVGAVESMDARAVRAGRFVFMPLSFEYLRQWGDNWQCDCPPDLLAAALRKPTRCAQEHVVFAAIITEYEESDDDVSKYCDLLHRRVVRVDGEDIMCLEDLVVQDEAVGEEMSRVVEFENGFVLGVSGGVLECGGFGP